MKAVKKSIYMMIVVLAFSFGFGCGSSDNEDCNCGQGYICKNGKCVKNEITDGDIDLEPEPELEPELELEPEPELEPELEPEIEEEIEYECSEDNLDERCGFEVQDFCRDGAIQHPIHECRESNGKITLQYCNLTYDCSYPQCGWDARYIDPKTCLLGCVVNENPNMSDYCKEDGPFVDGDMDDDFEYSETEEEKEPDSPFKLQNGERCYEDSNCLSNSCKSDIDGLKKYCSDSQDRCVYHLNMEEDELAEFYSNGARLCMSDTSYKRCLSGSWVLLTQCAEEYCEVGTGIWHFAEYCDPGILNDAQCVSPDPDKEPCKDHLLCYDETICRVTCSSNLHCQSGYSCVDGRCEEDQQ